MSKPQRPAASDGRGRAIERGVFLAVSAVGIYALGTALRGLGEPGGSVSLVWLAVAGVALWILVAQMGRVHDTWPRRHANEGDMLQDHRSGSGTDDTRAVRPEHEDTVE